MKNTIESVAYCLLIIKGLKSKMAANVGQKFVHGTNQPWSILESTLMLLKKHSFEVLYEKPKVDISITHFLFITYLQYPPLHVYFGVKI